jgi:8-oxo-dGTP pyrophosphatase MutT (NUDIX family)
MSNPSGGPRRRPGYGTPHPDLVALLGALTPAAAGRYLWPGDVRLDIAAYPTPVPVPPDLVTSVRCIVRVDSRIVVCHAPDGRHIMPGGRREPDETYQCTARREVYEETGWLVDEGDLRPLGFLHCHLLQPPPEDHPFPHPDFLQLVYTAPAYRHSDPAGGPWTDLDGWEQGHDLLAPTDLPAAGIPETQLVFLHHLRAP